MNVITKQLQTLQLDEIIPYENNPRDNELAVDDVVNSILQCENLDPIEIDENNIILSGHTRLLALKRLGYSETEVIRYIGLTEQQKKKYRLLTNKTGEKATWDISKLDFELAELDFGDYDFGFDDTFSIDDMQEVDAYDKQNDAREHFQSTFTFPIENREKIISYLAKHKGDVVRRIIEEADAECSPVEYNV